MVCPTGNRPSNVAATLPAVSATLTTYLDLATVLSHFLSDGKIPLAFAK